MNRSERPPLRSRLPSYAMIAAPLVAVISSLVAIAVWPSHTEAQAHAQPPVTQAAAPYVSSDPSLPPPGSYALPTEVSVQVDAF